MNLCAYNTSSTVCTLVINFINKRTIRPIFGDALRVRSDKVFCPQHEVTQQVLDTPQTKVPQEAKLASYYDLNKTKIIHSNRLGITYEKKLTWSWRNQAFYLAFSNLKFDPKRTVQQMKRFGRAARIPRSGNEGIFLSSPSEVRVRKCRHSPSVDSASDLFS